jgi:Lipocalin-like domain
MKKLLPLGFVILLSCVTTVAQTGSQDREHIDIVRDQFIGAWRLAWLEEPGADGKVYRADCTGLLVYTREGYMSVQVMYNKPQTTSPAEGVQYAQAGYEASFGRYEINDANTFTFHVDGALVRTLVGKDLKRVFELSGKQLIVKSPDPKEHWRVAWEHY